MTDLQTRRLALLDETVQHFNSTNRAYKDGLCRYGHEFNGGCAIGRKCPPELAASLPQAALDRDILEVLPKEMQELGFSFLYDLQRIHDNASHWDESGLTDRGKARYQRVKTEIIAHAEYEPQAHLLS